MEVIIGADGARDRLLHEVSVSNRCQRDPEDTVRKLVTGVSGELKRDTCLPGAPSANECQQPVCAEQCGSRAQLVHPSNEGALLGR